MAKKSFFKKIAGPILLAIIYLIASKSCFILLLTVVASIVHLQNTDPSQATQIINDISYQYIFILYSIAAIFTLYVSWVYDRIFEKKSFFHGFLGSRYEFFRGVSTGFMVPFIVIFLLYISQQISFLGTFITSDTRSPIFFLFLCNALALAAMVLCEEFIFRKKILGVLISRISPMYSIFLTSCGYVIVKHFQFQLHFLDYINLFLLNIICGFFYLRTEHIFRGVGLLGTIFGVTHFICGLNLWGHNTAGLFLFTDAKLAFPTITGGNDGPLAGAAMTCVLLIITLANYFSWNSKKKIKK